jgi:hypothetical protein
MDKRMLKATANWLAQVDYDIATAEQMLHAGRYIYVIFMSHTGIREGLESVGNGRDAATTATHAQSH